MKGQDAITLSVPPQPLYTLEPVIEDEFKISGIPVDIIIRFDRDEDGNVVELISIQPNGTFKAKRKE
jgi:hypothetical protein